MRRTSYVLAVFLRFFKQNLGLKLRIRGGIIVETSYLRRTTAGSFDLPLGLSNGKFPGKIGKFSGNFGNLENFPPFQFFRKIRQPYLPLTAVAECWVR